MQQPCKKCKVSVIEMAELNSKAKVAKEREEKLQKEIDADQVEVGSEIICYESTMYFLEQIVDYRQINNGEARGENAIELKIKKVHDEIKAEYHSKWEVYERSRLSKMCLLREAIAERNTAVLNRFDATLDDVDLN